MTDSEILAAIKSLQFHLESQLMVTNQIVKQFMSSFDSGFASIQQTKPPLDFSSPFHRPHPPPTELSPFAKPTSDATGGGPIPSPFSTTHTVDSSKIFLQDRKVEVTEIHLEEFSNESRSGFRESIKAAPLISDPPSPPPNPFPNSSLQQLCPVTHLYADQVMEFDGDDQQVKLCGVTASDASMVSLTQPLVWTSQNLIDQTFGLYIWPTTPTDKPTSLFPREPNILVFAIATKSPSILHSLPQKIGALFQPPAEPPPHRSGVFDVGRPPEYSTWEDLEDFHRSFSDFNLEDKVNFKGGGSVTPLGTIVAAGLGHEFMRRPKEWKMAAHGGKKKTTQFIGPYVPRNYPVG